MQNQLDQKQLLAQFELLASQLFEDESKVGVAPFIPSKELFDSINLSLSEEGIDQQTFNQTIADLILKTPRTGTNKFFNQLFGGRQKEAVLGDLLAVLLNNSMYTYKAAGPQVGVEKAVIAKTIEIIGWNQQAAGTFAPGGSLANFMGLLMARDQKDASIRLKGSANTFRIYTSTESHYSTLKNASFAGIGRENVVNVAVNDNGTIDTAQLEKAIANDLQKGHIPLMVNATIGTTVLGAFDDLDALATICKKHNIWLHADGAYCGAVIFSNKYRHLISGIEKVDSFCFNAHKMLGTPLSCSLIFAKNGKALHESFANEASYLYQTDGDDFNLGKMSLQCGRRNDALKLWTLWKSIGTNGLEKLIDRQFELAAYAYNYTKTNTNYTSYSIPDSISICFNYKNYSAKKLCTLLYEQQELMVGYGEFNGTEFIRLVTVNANNSIEDIHAFFQTLEEFAAKNHDYILMEANALSNT